MNYEIIKEEVVYDGFLNIRKALVAHDSFYKKERILIKRESLERGDSVGVLVFEPETDCVLFVRQFRYPARKSGNGWMIEIPAGYVEQDEDPEESAQREVEEEMGYRATRFHHVCTFYLSPGYSSEKMFLYYTEVNSGKKVSDGGGNEDEDEDIELVRIPKNLLLEKIGMGDIIDAKSIIAIQWLLNRYK